LVEGGDEDLAVALGAGLPSEPDGAVSIAGGGGSCDGIEVGRCGKFVGASEGLHDGGEVVLELGHGVLLEVVGVDGDGDVLFDVEGVGRLEGEEEVVVFSGAGAEAEVALELRGVGGVDELVVEGYADGGGIDAGVGVDEVEYDE